MIGGEIVVDDGQITRETLENIQSKVIELMSATLELNEQLHALANIELYKNKIETLEAKIARLELEAGIFASDANNAEDDLHFEQYKNRCLQMEIDKLKRESQPERKYVEQIDW